MIQFDFSDLFKDDKNLLRTYEITRAVFVIIDAALIVGFVYCANRFLHYRPKLKPRDDQAKRISTTQSELFKERWAAVQRQYAFKTPDGLRRAIIAADQLTDDVLKKLEVPGDHLADRLDNLPPEELLSLERVLRAHLVRNEIERVPSYELTEGNAKRTI